MEKNFFEILNGEEIKSNAVASELSDLNDLELTLIGGGIGDTVL